jgi:hypothetical protein
MNQNNSWAPVGTVNFMIWVAGMIDGLRLG